LPSNAMKKNQTSRKPCRDIPSRVRFNLLDKEFGSWAVVGFIGREHENHTNQTYWLCRCACGRLQNVSGVKLRKKETTQYQRCAHRRRKEHELSGTRSYEVWRKKRVAGVLCSKWPSFDAFVADMGTAPRRVRLSRLDATQPYSPDNAYSSTPTSYALADARRTAKILGVSSEEGIARLAKLSRERRRQLRNKVPARCSDCAGPIGESPSRSRCGGCHRRWQRRKRT